MLEKTAMKEAYLLSDTHNYREDCCGLRRGRPVTNTGMPLHIFQSIFINRQSATMFYSPRECLMHNYSLSKQIYTVDFFFFSRALMRLTGSLSVWLAECSVLSLCKVFWCSLDAGLAHWAANGLGSMTRDGGGCSEGPFVFSLCCYFGLIDTELSHGNRSEITSTFSHIGRCSRSNAAFVLNSAEQPFPINGIKRQQSFTVSVSSRVSCSWTFSCFSSGSSC